MQGYYSIRLLIYGFTAIIKCRNKITVGRWYYWHDERIALLLYLLSNCFSGSIIHILQNCKKIVLICISNSRASFSVLIKLFFPQEEKLSNRWYHWLWIDCMLFDIIAYASISAASKPCDTLFVALALISSVMRKLYRLRDVSEIAADRIRALPNGNLSREVTLILLQIEEQTFTYLCMPQRKAVLIANSRNFLKSFSV